MVGALGSGGDGASESGVLAAVVVVEGEGRRDAVDDAVDDGLDGGHVLVGGEGHADGWLCAPLQLAVLRRSVARIHVHRDDLALSLFSTADARPSLSEV